MIGVLGILIGWRFSRRAPAITYEVLASANVVEVNEDTEKLDVLYDGKSIKATGGVLKVVTLRIVNRGTAPVRVGDYADEEPLGFLATHGKIIERPQTVSASNKYLSSRMTAIVKDDRRAAFPPAVLNPNDYVTVKTLILTDAGHAADDVIEPIGVVAGVDEIHIRRMYDPYEGSIWWGMHPAIRWPLVMVMLLAVLVGIGLLFLVFDIAMKRLSEKCDRKRRIHLILNFKRKSTYVPNAFTRRLFNAYRHQQDALISDLYGVLVHDLPPKLTKTTDVLSRCCERNGKRSSREYRDTMRAFVKCCKLQDILCGDGTSERANEPP